MVEPTEENSGMPQGAFIRRHRIPKEGSGFYGVEDLFVGAQLNVYKKLIKIYDCDEFTRGFLDKQAGATGPLPPLSPGGNGCSPEDDGGDDYTVVTQTVCADDGSSIFPPAPNSPARPQSAALPCPEGEYDTSVPGVANISPRQARFSFGSRFDARDASSARGPAASPRDRPSGLSRPTASPRDRLSNAGEASGETLSRPAGTCGTRCAARPARTSPSNATGACTP